MLIILLFFAGAGTCSGYSPRESLGAHNFATVDNKAMKLFCGNSISHKLSIHLSHIEIDV